MLTSIIEYLSVCCALPFHTFVELSFLSSQTLVYASRRNCIKSRELIKKMVRWNDPATCDAAELGDPALADVAGAFDKEGDELGVEAPELDDEGVVAGEEVEVDITDVGVPGVVDEGAAAGL